MDKSVKKEIISRILSICSTLTFLIVATWFWFGPRVQMTEAKTAMSGVTTNNLEFVDLSEGIKLENAYPVPDSIGQNIEPYRFKIVNHGNSDEEYTIMFVNDLLEVEKDKCKVLDNNYLRYSIKKDDGAYTEPRNLAMDGIMYIDSLASGESATYELKFWVDYNAGNEIMNTHFHAKVAIAQNVK